MRIAVTILWEVEIMRLHVVGKPNSHSQPQFKRRDSPGAVEVADISAKITETLERFDVQLLAAERALEMMHRDAGATRDGAPHQELQETEHPTSEPAAVSPVEVSVIPWPAMSRSVEDVSHEQSKANNATD
jgi:hypothetical protein